MPVIPRELAAQDAEHAIEYYLSEAGSKVALRFVDALEKAYRHIGRRPGVGSPRYAEELNLPGLRVWPLERFPYLVFFVACQTHIDVWRVLHATRDVPARLRGSDKF